MLWSEWEALIINNINVLDVQAVHKQIKSQSIHINTLKKKRVKKSVILIKYKFSLYLLPP